MDRKRSLSTTLALGLMMALLAGLAAHPGSAASMAREPEPEGKREALAPLGTAFTYQGRLEKDGVPVDGICNLQFSLWNALSGGSQVGPPQTRTNVQLREGLFTVADLDFGGGAFTGEARWLEVAVQCSGDASFNVLGPRQALTAAPYASYAAQVGAHSHLGQTWTGSGSPLIIGGSFGSPGWAPLIVSNSSGDGLKVTSTSNHGLSVDQAGWSGLAVYAADQDGVYVDSAGGSGLAVNWAAGFGVAVNSAGGHGMYVASASSEGMRVEQAGRHGMYVVSAGDDGVRVDSALGDGVYVERVGNPSLTAPNALNNGFEVAGTEGHGLYVGRAEELGVYVNSAGGVGVWVNASEGDGMKVYSAGSPDVVYPSAASDGYEVAGAGGDGLYVGHADDDGLDVYSAGDTGVNAAGANYAGVFWGDIVVWGDCIGCVLATFGVNADGGPLGPGDVVALQGVQAAALDNAHELWQVVPARDGAPAVGVVRGRAELDVVPEDEPLRKGETGRRLVPRDGAAQPGAYLIIVIHGPVQVPCSVAAGSIRPGTRLVVDAEGRVRALRTVTVEGIAVAESTPVLGIALEAAEKDGLIWVLVNPQ